MNIILRLALILAFINFINCQIIACAIMSIQDCKNSGYCNWKSNQCEPAECHKVQEVRACFKNGYLFQQQLCKINPNIDSKFRNLCIEFQQNTLLWGYLVYPQDQSQLSTYVTSNGLQLSLISTLKYPGQFKSEVLTLNILNADSSQLLNIMYGYLQQSNELCHKDIPIQFLEKAIYESMQQIRDDESITSTKQNYYWALWGMTDAFFLKLRSQKINHYISYKYLINFGFAHLKFQKLEMQTQYMNIKITWQYQSSGYIEVLVMPSEQFGFQNAKSDLIMIRISDLNGYNKSTQINILWTYQIFDSQFQNIQQIDPVQMTILREESYHCSYQSCFLNFYCNETRSYIIGNSSIKQCSGRKQSSCRLGSCTWNFHTRMCQ